MPLSKCTQPDLHCGDIILQRTQTHTYTYAHTFEIYRHRWSNAPHSFQSCYLYPYSRQHARFSALYNAASGEYVNNLDENDASRRFSSQLTPLQHQEHISIAAVCVCVNEGQKDRLLVPKGKKNKHTSFLCIPHKNVMRKEHI